MRAVKTVKRLALAIVAGVLMACESPTEPSPMLTIAGQVTEPAADRPVEGASVCWSPPPDPERCASTRADGTYVLVTGFPRLPPGATNVRLAPYVSREGFEYRKSFVPYDRGDRVSWSPGLQRKLQIEAGSSISGTVYPQEGSGAAGSLTGDDDGCEACKRISIAVRGAGELTIRLTAEREELRLALPPFDKRSLDAPISVQPGDVVIVLVIGSVVATKFEIATTFAPKG